MPCHPQQIEFSRLDMLYTVTSKRRLAELVAEGHVAGWDDPRMPTISGMRRRGYTPEAIQEFCRRIGVSKAENKVGLSVLETCVRDDLGPRCKRVWAVLDPIKVVITNWPEGEVDWLDCAYHPQQPELGSRKVPFTGELYIERDDFMEDPPRKYFRLKPEGAVRLRYGYVIDFEELVKDEGGNIVEIRCTYDPDTRSGTGTSERKVKGTIHWVPAGEHAVRAPVRVYDRLFTRRRPADGKEGRPFTDYLNPESLVVYEEAVLEPSLADTQPGEQLQFERLGYFIADVVDSKPGAPVFNRTVTLRDSWAKIEQEQREAEG